ncbi:MAG: UvrB/UvrC motif-containing protein [Spirochaetia bacterium]
MDQDLWRFLRDWEYDPEHPARIISLNSGREVLQVRLPLGVEQYELEGRPDNERPFGRDTVLEEIKSRIEKYTEKHGSDKDFLLSDEEFALLEQEALLFYYRYLVLFQINQYQRTANDTEHNLEVADIVEKYVDDDYKRNLVLQYRPYMLRINALSRAMLAVSSGLVSVAREVINSAVTEIEGLAKVDSPSFQLEQHRSINQLKSALAELENDDDGAKQALQEELNEAVQREDYELAAQLRDKINELTHPGNSNNP